MKKVALHTLGCKLNFAETSTIGRQFLSRGYEIVGADQPADIFVLNTCSVTERADRECRQIIRRTLRHSPEAYVVVTGCYAQLQPQEIASIQGVDLVLGSPEKFHIFNYGGDFTKNSASQIFVSCIDEAESFSPAYSAEVGGRTRAFLKIQDGCDYQCSFCTIPMARGGSRSMPAAEVAGQARMLAGQGYKEIVLTGVNVGDYRAQDAPTLLMLLKELDGVDGIERIRVSSIEPNLLTREMIDFILSSERFCNHFHIPLQSGSDQILRLMRRRYVRDHYRELVDDIRRADPDACIGADVIVGFPGETDRLFEETYNFLGELPLSYLHVFTYSERERTASENFAGRVEPGLRFRRNEVLRLLGREKRAAFHSRFVGKTLPVLFEHAHPRGRTSGLTTNYIRVGAEGDDSMTNTIRSVRISGADDECCSGSVQATSEQSRESLSNLPTNLYGQFFIQSPNVFEPVASEAVKELR
ncbi:MAG TPA: tRNA (N(6)-L-threonylcarbamoyladenosine(37)-C(2))-methylthiotransferase MtaB [Bacteroidota bacterium]|jgi:threonylcarbamoyladenosine tRNA methylthiotransferase MtaB|nr:tRNA (N(6)-L-threonylcarbamoyladenosine(37)-C(2))-methylthiotransferase MtaB [Bacteroidota bacterium]